MKGFMDFIREQGVIGLVVGMDRVIINLAHLGSDKEFLDRLELVLVDWVEESVR